MAVRDPPIPGKRGWVSKGGKFVGERRWNGECQRESVRLSSDVPHCSTVVKEAGGVMEGRELGNTDAGEAEERQGLPETRGNAKG